MKKTLADLAKEKGFEGGLYPSGDYVEIEPFRYAIAQKNGSFYLLDVSKTLFNARQIGRKSGATEKGFEFQIAQLKRWKKQIGELVA
jgi:hypothetical protein